MRITSGNGIPVRVGSWHASEAMRNKLGSIPVFASVEAAAFGENEFPDNPLAPVAEWILAAAAAGHLEPHAMSLCTVGPSGIPSSRVLIVKDIDDGPDGSGLR